MQNKRPTVKRHEARQGAGGESHKRIQALVAVGSQTNTFWLRDVENATNCRGDSPGLRRKCDSALEESPDISKPRHSPRPLIIGEDGASVFSHQAINLPLGLRDGGSLQWKPAGNYLLASETHCWAPTAGRETHSPPATGGSDANVLRNSTDARRRF
ncbi:unnamed protein product [Pleuronectes platessa]|uniref:Uncharacterized protein n=1 Tax=Pleuronectes platessa TaxID=8262 RepID=A0A9N7UXM9_PLEPL|nr:unnamed protein product [Pleuronectes platessa]